MLNHYFWDEWNFNNQYDLDGNIVFAGKGTTIPKDLGVINIRTDEIDNRMYDVMGREIREPLPGTIYIQNGRKFIAR